MTKSWADIYCENLKKQMQEIYGEAVEISSVNIVGNEVKVDYTLQPSVHSILEYDIYSHNPAVEWKAQGLCPSCGHKGDWIAMAAVCPTHGKFLG